MSAKVIKLVAYAGSKDTENGLETLHADAKGQPGKPRLIGYAIVAVYEGRQYVIDVVGEAEGSLAAPVRGYLGLLDAELVDIISGDS